MRSDADITRVVRIVLAVLDELDTPAAPLRPRPDSSQPSRIVTERDVIDAAASGRLRVARGAVITPLAREAAQARGVTLDEAS